MDRRLFCEKLAHYASREPRHFLQLDAHHLNGYDDEMRPDEHGEALTASGTVELMHGASVRVLIQSDRVEREAPRPGHLPNNPDRGLPLNSGKKRLACHHQGRTRSEIQSQSHSVLIDFFGEGRSAEQTDAGGQVQ